MIEVSHPTAEALVRTILADPADPLPRLVFADWLDETDAPANHAWAKYLRLAVDLVHLPLTPPRRAYLEALQAEAAGDVRAALTVKAEQFVQHVGAFRQLLPLRCLTLNVETFRADRAVLELIPESVVREYSVLPLAGDGTTIVAAVPAAAVDVSETRDRLQFILNRRLEFVRAGGESLLGAIEGNFGPNNTVSIDSVHYYDYVRPIAAARDAELSPLQREADSGPVARVVAMLLADAVNEATTEVTLERHGPRVEVRFLHDGERKLWGGFPERLHLPLVARFQMLADLNLGAVQADQIGTLPHVHRGRLLHLGVRVQPARLGPRVLLTVPPAPEPPRGPNLVA